MNKVYLSTFDKIGICSMNTNNNEALSEVLSTIKELVDTYIKYEYTTVEFYAGFYWKNTSSMLMELKNELMKLGFKRISVETDSREIEGYKQLRFGRVWIEF